MRRILITTIILIFMNLIQAEGQSFDVAEGELTSGVPEVEFNNYTGEWDKRETIADVSGIGESLSRGMTEDNQWSRYYLKYSVIHAVSEEEPDLLAADIFSIDQNAQVNHIYSVRLIISGFLQEEYGYTEDEALLLAKFITYYNAYYRGNVDYLSGKYKTVVMDSLTADNAGISVNYYDWPGKTRVIIPLTRFADQGTISSIDTDTVSDENVTTQMDEDEGRSIEDREDMINLKEDQIEEMEDIQEKKKEELEEKIEEKEKLDEEIKEKEKELEETEDEEEKKIIEEEIEEKEEDIEEIEEDIEEMEEDIEKDEEDIEKKKETVEKEKEELEEKKEKEEILSDPEKALEEIEEREKEVEEKEKELEEREEETEVKEEELDEREDKLRDELLDDNVYDDNLYYMQINNYYEGGYYNNKMHIINPETMEIETTSTYKTISGDDFDVYSGGVVVIGYQGQSYLNHQLILLDLETLEPKYDSSDFVFHRSFLEIYDGYIYVVIRLSDQYYLGKYDSSLDRVARSSEAVAEDTFISFFGDKVYVNSTTKNIMVLNMDDLSMIETITP